MSRRKLSKKMAVERRMSPKEQQVQRPRGRKKLGVDVC